MIIADHILSSSPGSEKKALKISDQFTLILYSLNGTFAVEKFTRRKKSEEQNITG